MRPTSSCRLRGATLRGPWCAARRSPWPPARSSARAPCAAARPPAHASPPHAPIVAPLRPLAREHHPVFDELTDAERAELARLLPMVDAPAADGDDSGASAQARLFEALLALLDCLGRDGPALLVIEDLHW